MVDDVKRLVQDLAAELGFHRAVVGSLQPMEQERENFDYWLSKGYAAGMEWLKRNPQFRTSPQLLYPNCRSAIIVSVSYFTDVPPPPPGVYGRVARYAVGLDYHVVLRAKLRELKSRLEAALGRPILGKAFTDDVALYEQAYANRHGLGFKGKNTMIIGPRLSGSYNFVAELFTDLDIEADEPYQGTCGACFRCGTKCPTDAIVDEGTVDAGRCISYLTIENKGEIPLALRSKLGEWVFGCDVCQEVCPYNQRPPLTPWAEFAPERGAGHHMDLLALLKMNSEEEFHSAFVHSAVRRPKLRGMLRNTLVVLGNKLAQEKVTPAVSTEVDHEQIIQAIDRCAHVHDDPLLREHAVWSLAQSSSPKAHQLAGRLIAQESDIYARNKMRDMLI